MVYLLSYIQKLRGVGSVVIVTIEPTPSWTPIGPATTCIQGGNRRHALHMNACPAGSTWGRKNLGHLSSSSLSPHPISKRGGASIVVVVAPTSSMHCLTIQPCPRHHPAVPTSMCCHRAHIPQRGEGSSSSANIVAVAVTMVLIPHTREPRRTPIGLATTCIQGGNHKHASHMDACLVGSTLGEAAWGKEWWKKETWIKISTRICLFG